jgi:prepilin-type N-terminal cleavage/methylation domain-containing protein
MKQGEKGFAYIELIVALAIITLISSATTTATLQVLKGTGRNNDHVTAVCQVQNVGYRISRDIQMAQSVSADNLTPPDFLILSWTEESVH